MTDPYDSLAFASSRQITNAYSTSFGSATKLFPIAMRPHIYNIYGLVRIADEVVDTYKKPAAEQILEELEQEVYAAIKRQYSTNMVVHAFALTAKQYGISKELIAPFFASMRTDAPGNVYRTADYESYIHGSAEVVGLMCLRVFCEGDSQEYDHLAAGAKALGSAFQKVNFLRDLAEDYKTLGRYYFPVGSFAAFDEDTKRSIISDIEHDFAVALPAIQKLPDGARPAVTLAYRYYKVLLQKLSETPAAEIKQRRIRVNTATKLRLLWQVRLGRI